MSNCPECTATTACTDACVNDVYCAVCNRRKHLSGRSMAPEMAQSLCGYDCPGNRLPPQAPHLWPNEWADHIAGHPRDLDDLI